MVTGNTTNQGLGTTGQVLIGGTTKPVFSSTVTGDGFFNYESNTSGSNRKLYVSHTSNTAGSGALLETQVAGTSGGGSFYRSTIGSSHSFCFGAQASATPTLQVRYQAGGSAAPNNGTQIVVATTVGEITLPSQPSFVAYNSATLPDVTGDNTGYSPIAFNTEIFDQNSDYDNTTYTFTAPVTGRYYFFVLLLFGDVDATFTRFAVTFTTSNRNYTTSGTLGKLFNADAQCSISFAVMADMDALDTCVVSTFASGGTKTIDIVQGGPTDIRSCFGGQLIA